MPKFCNSAVHVSEVVGSDNDVDQVNGICHETYTLWCKMSQYMSMV